MPLVLVLDDDRRVPIDRPISVGADRGCDLVVAGLAEKHARFEPGEEWTFVRAEGNSEVSVNDVVVADGETRALLPGDRILFGAARGKVAYEETNVPMKTAELALAALNRMRSVPRIVIVAGSATGARRELTVEGAPIRLGRGRDCDWCVDDDKVSRAHVRFVLRGGQVLVRDLESARGTFMGAARLDPQKDAPWKAGVSLRAGGLVLTLVGTIELDAALAEVAERAALPEVAPASLPLDAARHESTAAAPVAPVTSSPPHPAGAEPSRRLQTRVVMTAGIALITACVAALLWILFSGR